MARLRKRSAAKQSSAVLPSTTQPTIPVLEPEVVQRVRNFSYHHQYNQGYYNRIVGEHRLAPKVYCKGSDTNNDRMISLSKGRMASNIHDLSKPVQHNTGGRGQYPRPNETLDFFQYGEFTYRKKKFQPQKPVAPTYPSIEDVLSRQSFDGAVSLSVPLQRPGLPPTAAPVRTRLREEVPNSAVTLPGIRRSSGFPIVHVRKCS